MIAKSLGQRILWSRTRDYIAKYEPTLIGVTGSYGKTLTKEAIALVLQDVRHVRASHASYNTPIGVALSALGIKSQATKAGWVKLLATSRAKEAIEVEPDTIILELGARYPSDIDWVVQQLPFSIGVVTNIGSTNLEYFTNKDMVAHECMSLPISLPPDGTAILNIDDPLIRAMQPRLKCKVITFGISPAADVKLVHMRRLHPIGFALQVDIHGFSCQVSLPHIFASHQLTSVLAAIATATAFHQGPGIPPGLAHIAQLKPPPGRMNILPGKNQSTIIDDSYNAAPESMSAALKTLRQIPAKRKIAILGDMQKLGGATIHHHVAIGQEVTSAANIFIAVGQDMKHAQAAALESGHNIDIHHFRSSKEVGQWIEEYLQPGDLILVKGSHDMHMEKIVNHLQQTV